MLIAEQMSAVHGSCTKLCEYGSFDLAESKYLENVIGDIGHAIQCKEGMHVQSSLTML